MMSPPSGNRMVRNSLLSSLYLLFFLYGAAALGYQLIWSKIFAVGLGHEMASVLAVVCAFLGGMSVGALFFERIGGGGAKTGVGRSGRVFVGLGGKDAPVFSPG